MGRVSHALERGACVSAADSNGWTALHNAMLAGAASLPIATALVAHGASVAAATNDGETPLHLCHEADPKIDWKVSRGSTADGRTSFFAAALVQLLIDAHADPNATTSDGDASTPLHLASAVGASATVMALLHSGADVRARDRAGRTALQRAGQDAARPLTHEHAVRLRVLLKAAADPQACNVEGFSLCGAPCGGTRAELFSARVDALSSDEEGDSWTAALAAVPTELPARLYSAPLAAPRAARTDCSPSRSPPLVAQARGAARRLSPPAGERRPPLSPPSRKRAASHANIVAGGAAASGSPPDRPKTPKSARRVAAADLENFTL